MDIICSLCGRHFPSTYGLSSHNCRQRVERDSGDKKAEYQRDANTSQKKEPEIEHKLRECPECHLVSLFYVEKYTMYECLNLKCKKLFARTEITIIDVDTETS